MAIMSVFKVNELPAQLMANAFYILKATINGEPDKLQFVVTDSDGLPYTTPGDEDLAQMIADVVGAQFLVDSVTINNTGTNPVPIASVQLGEVQENPTEFTLADRLKVVAALLQNRLPSTLGAKTGANSLPIVLSTDDVLTGNFGAKTDTVADDDTGTFSHISLVKRVAARLTTLISKLPTSLTAGGALKVGVTETTGLTDSQLRAAAVPVSGPLTDAQLRATAVPISGPLTDQQLRNSPVPISGKMTTIPGLDIPVHDHISLSYTDNNITGVVYKLGGSGGTTVATLVLSYSNGKLTSVTKS